MAEIIGIDNTCPKSYCQLLRFIYLFNYCSNPAKSLYFIDEVTNNSFFLSFLSILVLKLLFLGWCGMGDLSSPTRD